MVNPIPVIVQKTWEEWNVQVFLLLSLFLQMLLTFLAPFRKRTASLTLSAIIWLAYLLADWVASFAVGLISSTIGKDLDSSNSDLFALWVSFLLLHLGGPDTITALSLEDNALWLRQLLALVFQVVAAAYIVLLSLPSSLLVPTLLVFFAGISKYAERLRALYLVSSDIVFEERVLRGQVQHLGYSEEEKSKYNTTVFTGLEGHHPELVLYARRYYDLFRGFVHTIFTGNDYELLIKDIVRDLLAVNPDKAMEIISIQLNWLYQILYTKALAVRSKRGYTFRFASFSALVAALLLFCLSDKSNFEGVNTVITYILLGGAVLLDALSLFLLIPVDWAFSEICKKNYRVDRYPWVNRFIHNHLKLRRPNWARSSAHLFDWSRQLLFRRWCESVYGYNVIEYHLREKKSSERGHTFTGILGTIYIGAVTFFGLKDVRDRLKYVSRKPLSKELWDFILKQVIVEQGVFETHCETNSDPGEKFDIDKDPLFQYPEESLSFQQIVLRNHIATEIYYNFTIDDSSMSDEEKRHREFSKVLSDYMLYLLIFTPGVVSSMPNLKHGIYSDTCSTIRWILSNANNLGPESDLGQACKEISKEMSSRQGSRHIILGFLQSEIKGQEFDWDRASSCWAKILIHGAYYSKPESHARLLTGGGELISHVWLAMGYISIGQE